MAIVSETETTDSAAVRRLADLRLAVLNRALWFVLTLGTATFVVGVAVQAFEGGRGLVVFYSALYATSLVAALVLRLGYYTRAALFLLVLYVLGVSELWMFGVSSIGRVILLGFVIFTAVFFSRGLGAGSLCLSLAAMCVTAYSYTSGMIPIVHEGQQASLSTTTWLTGTLVFCLMGMSALTMVGLLLQRLTESLESAERLVDSLRGENAERRRAEESARESAKTLRQVIDLVPQSIYAKDSESRFIFVNRRSAELMGTTPEEAVGKTQMELTSVPEEARVRIEQDQEVVQTGQPVVRREYSWTDPGGEVHVEEITAIPFASQLAEGRAVLGVSVDVTERKRAEEKLRRSEQHFRSLIENASDVITVVDEKGVICYASPSAQRVLGYPPESNLGNSLFALVHPEDLERVRTVFETALRGRGVSRTIECRLLHRDGDWVVVEASGKSIRSPEGEIRCVINYQDITDRTRLEAQLRQSQKMEAIGELAGGVAHDFNNLLQAILGYGQFALDNAEPGTVIHEHVEQVMRAADRATALVRQLLAFSRRQVLEPESLNLNTIVDDVANMIHRLIGEHLALDIRANADPDSVWADRNQIEQVIVNLCVNARDAMPDGGRITVGTENVEVREPRGELQPGRCVVLRVADTGAGMDEETLRHVFEPFFTTKEVGKGTGLGLSTVYGIVHQHNGVVEVCSEPGMGTQFSVYLPGVIPEIDRAESVPTVLVTGAGETILLAEDDVVVRQLARDMLEGVGYTVHEACDGEEAIQLFDTHGESISLALLDVIMPKVVGKAVFDHIRSVRKETPVLFASGYSADISIGNLPSKERVGFIQKPYRRDALLEKIREVLGA